MQTSSLLTQAQTRAVIDELRSRFPGRDEFRYAAVTLDIGAPDPNRINLLMTVVSAAIDANAIYVTPTAIVAMDEQVIALIWLVNNACPPEKLELLQTKMAANVQAALQFGMQTLAEREQRLARAH